MAISTNTKWAYGTAITPETMNNIECAIENSIMGAIEKSTYFKTDGTIEEYFGPKIVINNVDFRNKKITTFLEDGNIQEEYNFYYNYKGDVTKGYCYNLIKTITFDDEKGEIIEIISELSEGEIG